MLFTNLTHCIFLPRCQSIIPYTMTGLCGQIEEKSVVSCRAACAPCMHPQGWTVVFAIEGRATEVYFYPPTHTEYISGSWCGIADVTLLVAAMISRDITIDVLNVRDMGTFHVEKVFGQYPQTLQPSTASWTIYILRHRGQVLVRPDTTNPNALVGCNTYLLSHSLPCNGTEFQSYLGIFLKPKHK